jgi:hypothetical protein
MKASLKPPDASNWIVTEDRSCDEETVSLKVPFPDDYPDTEFRQTSEFIAELLLSYKTKRNTMTLHMFYVHSVHSDYATADEKRAVKGLGKRMLCHVLSMLLARKSITQDTILSLEASGGRFDDDMVSCVMQMFTKAEVEEFLADFPTTIDNIVEDMGIEWKAIPWRDKAELKCMYDENQKLVRYYKTYGLHALSVDKSTRDVTYEPMHGTVRDILSSCEASADAVSGGRVVQTRYRRSPKRRVMR